MRIPHLIVAGAVALLTTGNARTDACDCMRLSPLSPAVVKEAPFIFEGKVIEKVERSLHTLRTTSGGGSTQTEPMGREIVFEVRRAWNGVATQRITVAGDDSDCEYPFQIDHTYVVFAWKDAKGGPATGLCTRTVESSKAADVIAALGPATTPR